MYVTQAKHLHLKINCKIFPSFKILQSPKIVIVCVSKSFLFSLKIVVIIAYGR